jgi:hypothetical protein
MKSYIHEYKKYGPISRCKVYIMERDFEILIGFENMDDGTSVTNASEDIATEIIQKEGFDPKICRFFEWYPEYYGEVSEITYVWKDLKASDPTWTYYCKPDANPFHE